MADNRTLVGRGARAREPSGPDGGELVPGDDVRPLTPDDHATVSDAILAVAAEGGVIGPVDVAERLDCGAFGTHRGKIAILMSSLARRGHLERVGPRRYRDGGTDASRARHGARSRRRHTGGRDAAVTGSRTGGDVPRTLTVVATHGDSVLCTDDDGQLWAAGPVELPALPLDELDFDV